MWTERDSQMLAEWFARLSVFDYYELLRVDSEASVGQIQEAFRTFVETFHPDAHPSCTGTDRERLTTLFARGVEAYEVLSRTDLRPTYDAMLKQSENRPPPRITSRPAKHEP